ncbi:MAG: hypothetical protein IT460_00475 [Planctomycetes bacterium]|nr:hypothetical protein [Planctomycetota bacterium]
MTPSRRSSILRRLVLLGLVAAAPFAVGRPARAGWDDFEFVQALIQRGYIEQARKLVDSVLADEKRPKTEKDKFRYALALLGKAEAVNAIGNASTPWSDASSKMDAAIASIEDFIQKYPDDPAADSARMESASFRQWFVSQAADLAEDTKACKERGTTSDAVLSDASKHAESAVKTYEWLANNAKDEKNTRPIAKYWLAVMSYYQALTYPKCSSSQRDAIAKAKQKLADYAYDNDGFLTGVFAQDFEGLAAQADGDCLDGPEKWKAYRLALERFSAAASTDDQGDEYRKVIALGFYHVGRLANHVAKTEELGEGANPAVSDKETRDLLKEARRYLPDLEKRAKATKLETGLLAMVEWGLVEWRLDAANEAIRILKRASELGSEGSFPRVVARANAALAKVATGGGSGGDDAGGDPSVLFKVAEDLRGRGKFVEAVGAYRKVVRAGSAAPDTLRKYVYPAWFAMGQCYDAQKLPMEAAACYDVLLDEARAGRVTPDKADDTTKRLVRDSMERWRKLLNDLAALTGDSSDKARSSQATDYTIKELPKWIPGGEAVVGDLAFRRARELFDGAVKDKEDGKPAATWRKGFEDSLPLLAETGKNLTSPFQDAALDYVVRARYELGDLDGAIKSAGEARAFWASDAAKKRASDDPKVAESRGMRVAAVDYTEAVAHHDAKRDADSLKILDGFVAKHGRAAGPYLGRAIGLRVEILAAAGKIADAEAAFGELLREAPDSARVPAIQARLAAHYQAIVKEVQGRIDAVNLEISGPPDDRSKGVRTQLFEAERAEQGLVAVISDLNQLIARNRTYLGQPDQPERERKKKQEELEKAEKDLVEAKKRLAETRARAEDLRKRLPELLAKRAALEAEQVPSLRKMTELYKQLDDALVKMEAGGGKKLRKPEGVADLAFKYFRLARQNGGTASDWETSRDLFEQYFAFPEVKALPDSDKNKRAFGRYAGEVWYHLAETGADAAAVQKAYQKALVYLMPSAARNPASAKVVAGVLRGELAVLPFKDRSQGKSWHIPVRKVDSVAAFRDAVRDLSGDALPRFTNDATQVEYERAVAQFKQLMGATDKKDGALSDEELGRTVKSLKDAGFDPGFYSVHGLPDNDFLLQLGRAAIRSAVAADASAAIGAARAVLDCPPRPLDDSAEWWEGKTLQLEVAVTLAERTASADGGDSALAKRYAGEADTLMVTTKQTMPRIGGGGPEAKDVLARWKDLRRRLDAVAGKLGIPLKPVDLDALPPEPAAEPAPAPAPAMDDK